MARFEDFKKSVDIDFQERWGITISLDISAGDADANRLRSDTVDILNETIPWYSILHKLNFVYVALSIPLAMVIALALAVTFAFELVSTKDSNKDTSLDSVIAQLVPAGIMVISFLIGLFANRLRDKVFPRKSFLIGQGIDRYANTEKFQWVVVIGFLVSLIAGLVILLVSQ